MSYDYFYGQSGELFSYFRIPKALFQDHRFRQLSTDARTLYGILLDRMSLSAKNGWLDEQGRVYIIYTVREVQESLCCAEHKAVKLFRELEDIDLIERKRRGLGRPSLIYVKDFSSGLPKAQVQNCPNSNSGAAESAILVQPKPQANKTDKNKTEMNKPDPIHSGNIREQLEDYFYQALEVELLLRLCPDDEDTIYQIVDMLVDTCSTKRKMLRIAGDDKPTEVVRSRLKKLNADHIRFVLESLAENTAPVRNMKQYLLAMLYNAPTTMNLYYILLGLVATNFGEAWRLAEGKELGDKIMSMVGTLPLAFANPLPSLHPLDLLIGFFCGAGLRLAVYLRSKNAKKYRHGMEYGSARWGTAKDIEPFMASKFADNIILTKTERLMMSNRPPDPKNARNKNVLVVGGSGSGKTRFWLKPNLLQCHSSYVVTDPKGYNIPR